ncbi:MAG: kelch repeat-containing protein, partial [Elusimicrobiota bacterium]|nr:kelch repeat-containing protein [Elusimicrobiota bacterium]
MSFLIFNCLYGGSSTTYTTDIQFNAGTKENTMVFGTGADGYVNLVNNFYDITASPQPFVRRWSAADYNSTKDKIILFGGTDGNPLNDTWIYNPQTNQWTQKSPSSIPNARYGHILVSDGVKAFLFGGYNGADYFNDTWEYDFDTDNWTQIATISSPTPRAWSCADYDLDNGKIILFGGRFYDATISSETWIYHIGGSSWTKGGYGPPARLGAAGCYESENKKFLIFGGEGVAGNYLLDTWEYNYNSNLWSNRTPSANPSGRTEGAVCYDSRNKRSVLFGGRNASGNKDDIWFYDYAVNKWSNSQPSQTASARYGFAMNYIPTIQKAFLFGGRDNSGNKNDFYNYVFRSSGIYTPVHCDMPFSTELYYQSVEAPTISGIPVNTTLEFQIASSADNSSYSDFIGWDGTSNTYFQYAGNPIGIGTSHNNKRYLKLKFSFNTTEPPLSGQLQSATVNFNRSPQRPSLSSPSNNFSTNDTTPDFNWYAVSDDDSDTVSYKIEID